MFIYICITNSITYQHLKHLKLLIFKTRTLKKIKLKPYMWVWKSLSCVQLFATPWTVAYQAPLSMGFCRQEYWSGLPFPSPGELPNPGIEPRSPVLQADALPSEPPDYIVHGIRPEYWSGVAFPFSRGSSQLRDQTQISCIAGGFFTIWATREAQ